jgi:hypothetical protein
MAARSRSLGLLLFALLVAIAQAGTFQIYDRWSYVSGTAVTYGGPLQSDVWHDATTAPLVVKLTLASFFSSSTTSPISAQASKKFIRLSSSANFIRVTGKTPQGGPVTTGFQVGAPQYYDYDDSTNALAAIPASIEFLITFDSKTTDVAGATFTLTYDCGALNNDINLVDTGSCISSKAAPGFQTVKIGWVPIISIHEVTGVNNDVYEDVTGQWIDLAPTTVASVTGTAASGAIPAHTAKKHVVRFAPQSGKQIFTGLQTAAPNGFTQNWGSLAHHHIFGKPATLDISSTVGGENVEDAWKKYSDRTTVNNAANVIPVTSFTPQELAFKTTTDTTITPVSTNVFYAGTKVFQNPTSPASDTDVTTVNGALDFEATVKKVSLTTSNYVEVTFLPTTKAPAGDYDVVIASMAFLRAGDFAPSAQTVFNVKSGLVVSPGFYETSAFDVKDAWFPADKSIALRVSTPLGAVPSAQVDRDLSTATGVYSTVEAANQDKYLVASYDVAPEDTSTKYGIGAGKLLNGMSSLPAGISGSNNEQIADKSYQTLGAVSTKQVWYQYSLATSGVAPGKYPFKIAQGSMFAAAFKTGDGGCVNDASGVCKCTDGSTAATLYRKSKYTKSPYIANKFDTHHLYAGDESCRGIIANARASADLKIGFVPTVRIFEGTPPVKTTDLDTRFDVTSKWLNLESQCAFIDPVGSTPCDVPKVPHALVITPPTGYLFDISTGNQPTTTQLLPWVDTWDGSAAIPGTYFSELRLSSTYASRTNALNAQVSQQLNNYWEVPFFAVPVDSYKPGAYSVIVESNMIRRKEDDEVEVKNARTVIVIRAGFDTKIAFKDSAPAPYLQDTDRWFLNTNTNVKLEITTGRLYPAALTAANKAQFALAADLADTFLPLANLQQSATSAAYRIPGYGIESGRALGGMAALPGNIGSTTTVPWSNSDKTVKYDLTLTGVEPGYFQFNISSGVLLRIVGGNYATGFYNHPTDSATVFSSLKLGYILQNEPRVCPGDASGGSNAEINRANLILSQSRFCAPSAVGAGLGSAVFGAGSTNADETDITVKALNTVNPDWWGGRVLKDQIQVFNYQKSHVLNIGFSLDYTITDASTKQVVTNKVGSVETLSWLNPTHSHQITFSAGSFDSNPQTFAVSTVTTPPTDVGLIDSYQIPAEVLLATPTNAKYYLNPAATTFCGTPGGTTPFACANAPKYSSHSSLYRSAAFLLPGSLVSKDESRITYSLQAESAALTGEYQILIPEGAFTREHTLAKNTRQVITVKVGHGLKVDFTEWIPTISAANQAAAIAGTFGTQPKWFNAEKTSNTASEALKLTVAHSSFASSVLLVTSSIPTWSTLFPVEKPGVSVDVPEGIVGESWVPTAAEPGIISYALSNINKLQPGSYRFDIPAGAFTEVVTSAPPVKNYAYTIYLKIGFPAYVDFVDGNKVSLMSHAGPDLQALSFSSEFLSIKKKTASARAVINTKTPEQTMAVYNTVLNTAVLSTNALTTKGVTNVNNALTFGTSTVDISIRGGLKPSTDFSSQFYASYLITGKSISGASETALVADSYTTEVKNGVYCTLKSSDCTFDADGVITPTCICNAPTHADHTSTINFAASDVSVLIASVDDDSIYSSPLAADLPAGSPQAGAGFQYNVFDPDFLYVQIMPIYASELKIVLTFTYASSPPTLSATNADWPVLIEAPSGFPTPTAPSNAGVAYVNTHAADRTVTYKWVPTSGSNVLIPGTWDLIVKPTVALGNPRARIRLVIGPNPVFYKLDKATQLVPRYPGGPFATNVNSLYLSIGGTKYRAASGSDLGCELKLSDILLVLDSKNKDVTKAITIDDTPITISTPNVIPGATASSVDAIQSSAPTYRIGLDGLTDGDYTFVIGGDLTLTPQSDALTAYNARALTAMALCYDGSALHGASPPYTSTITASLFTPVDATSSAKNVYASSSFKRGLKFKFTVDRVKPVPNALTYSEFSKTCRDAADSTTCTNLGPIYTTSPSGEIILPPSLFSDVGTPNDFLRVSVSSEDDRGIKLVRQYHTGPRNSPWPSGSIATDPLTLATTVLTTSSANVRDPAGSAVFIVNATDEAGNWAEASFTIPINKRSSGVLTAIDKRNVQSKSTLYTGSPDSLTSGNLKLVVVADFDVAVSGVTKDNLLCIAGNTPCWTGTSPVTLTAAPGGKRFTFNFDVAAAFVTQGKLITISVLMTRSDGTKVLSTRDSYEIAAPAPVFVSIDKTAVVPVTYVAPYRAVVNTKYTLVLPSKLFYDDVSTAKKIKLLSATPSSQFGLTFSSDLQGNATITGIPLAQPTTAYDNRVTFTIRGQDEAGNVNKEVIVLIGIHAASASATPSLTVLGSLLQFNENAKDVDDGIAFDSDVPSSKILNFDSTATFRAGTGQKFAAVYAYLTRPEPDEEKTVGVSCSNGVAPDDGRLTEITAGQGDTKAGKWYGDLSTLNPITLQNSISLVSRLGYVSAGYPHTDDYCRWERLQTSSSFTAPDDSKLSSYSVDPLTGEGRIGLEFCTLVVPDPDTPCLAGFANCRGSTKYRDSEVEPEVCTPGLDAATIQSWIQSLQYVNERTDVTNGNRIIRVDVWSPGHIAVGKRIDALGNLVTSLVGGDRPGFGVSATASRTLKVAAVNNAPRVTVHPTALWIEKGGPVAVLDQEFDWATDTLANSQVRITDLDDNDVTAAYVQIATSTDPSTAIQGPAYAGCDKTRDRLFLLPDYLDAGSKASSSPAKTRGALPKVTASWSSASCTLTLIPTAPLTRVTKEDMTVALLSIKYTNDDYYNPVNFDDGTTKNNHGRVRMISVYVEDAANQGKLADRKRNALLAKPTNQVYLFLQCYDDVPVVNVAKIFGIDGILSSTNSYANIRTTYDKDGVVKIRAFPLLTPPIYDSDGNTVEIKSQTVTPYQLEFDLTQVKDASGNRVPGLFAKGQIYDLDSTAPPTSPESNGPIDIKFFFDQEAPAAFSTGTAIPPADPPVGRTLRDMARTLLGDSNNGPNPGGEKCKTCVFYVNPGSGEPEYTDPVTKAYYKTGFVYSSTGPSVLTIILNNNVPLSRLGAYTLQLQFGYVNNAQVIDAKISRPLFWPNPPSSTTLDSWSAAKFYIDVRQKACIDPSASRAKAESSATETNILNRINADTTATGLLNQLTGQVVNTVTLAQRATYYPKFFAENSLCSYEPTSVIASSGLSYAVSRNNYIDVKSSLDSSLAALKATGASVESQSLALKDLRNQARGAFFVNIPAGSLASRGSMDFSATKVGSSSISLLPALKTSAIESYDTDVAVRLQPAGTTFSEPVLVCIFTGDTPEKHFKYLSMASQKDPGDPTKGYLYWETLSGQSFNPATGEVCGKTNHFTVFAPITRPTQESGTVDKAHLMGGSCPNQCSGQGTCRQQGQCVCFAGFEGYDCSMRTCPSAESWGQDQSVMHTQSECAGRGLCQRTTGTCSCFDGFEGAACERATCPNDCNGHGKCRTLGELPKVQQYGYSDWEVKRIQKCLCDGGFSGADCSQRFCPYGDDPETICRYQDRQVQRFTLDFYTDPTGTGRPDVDASTDQFALIFTTVSGSNYTTPMIDNIWEGTPESATAVKNALLTLPEFAVMGVEVSAVPTDSGSLSVSYDLTFTGTTNTGNEYLLSCPYNSLGSTGCPAPGCRPKFNQLRILKAPYLPPSVQLSAVSVLQQPKPLGSSSQDNNELTPNVFGVEITLVINKYFMPGTTTLVYTYSFVNTKVYGQAADASGKNLAVTFIETPFPPMKLRSSIPGPYGILFEFGSDTQLGIDFSGSGPFTFSFGWRLPSCAVEVVQYAAKEQEKAECSNRGICNRQSGECDCFDGYAGYSCAQQTVYV